MPGLVALSVQNFQKISEYSGLIALQNLESLEIAGDIWGPQYIKVSSIGFLSKMPQLKVLTLLAIRLQDKDWSTLLGLKNLAYLDVTASKEVKAIYPQIRQLPKLRFGPAAENPDFYLNA